jgi:GH25 family lysozyme M1 (1,4-beta-N-acetylmuramidase)
MKILSQRDSSWANVKIGKSNETVGKSGCLITDNSMITHYIENYRDPAWMAKNLDFTDDGYLYWQSLVRVKLDFVYRFYYRDDTKIKKAFADPDQFIVLQVDNYHWIWLVGVVGGYKIVDPYYGDIIYWNKRYKKITGFAILEKQDEDELTENDDVNEEESIISGDSPDFLALEKGDKFLDISHWNSIEDLSKTKSAGYKGIIHKCSQGTSNKDSAYIANKSIIRDLEFAFGAYHFSNAGDFANEAEWFVKNIGEIRNGDIIVLDYEIYARSDADQWCLNWMNYVKKITGLSMDRIILYTYHGMLNKYKFDKVAKAGYKLWVARYGLQEQEPNKKYKPSTGSFDKAWGWQYCSQGEVPGINKRVDLNIIC